MSETINAKLVNSAKDKEREFESVEEAEDQRQDLIGLGADPGTLEVIEVNGEGQEDSTENESSNPRPTEPVEEETEPEPTQGDIEKEALDEAKELAEEMESQSDTAVVDATPVKDTNRTLPKISPVEEKARKLIQELDSGDMNRLVWDPDANPKDVPYDPGYLPYDSPEPSAEAFDLFATIIEGAQSVQYSVEEVAFRETDKTIQCDVVIVKQTELGEKKLQGFKTSTMTDKAHWRERVYSKARRNALKQDIPSTFVATLLQRYREVK